MERAWSAMHAKRMPRGSSLPPQPEPEPRRDGPVEPDRREGERGPADPADPADPDDDALGGGPRIGSSPPPAGAVRRLQRVAVRGRTAAVTES